MVRAPVPGERRTEHLPEPMNNDGLAYLAQDAFIDSRIVARAFCRRRKRTAGHNHKAAAHRFDCLDLLFVGANDVVDTNVSTRLEMVGADPATDLDARTTLTGLKGMTDQLLCTGPIEPSASLCRIHCFGNAEAEIPKIVPKVDGFLPIDRGVEPGIGYLPADPPRRARPQTRCG